jgi:carboxypeptidase family protein/TonB-dependent receptor-like protein
MGRLQGRTLVASALSAAFVVVCAHVAGAQAVKGSLVGNIMDPAGFALPGVTVTITEVNTSIAYTAVTNESGNYTFSNLKDGKYRVGAELSGFKRVVRDGVDVPVNATVRVDLKMEVGAVEESVTVVGESPLLQTDRADTSRIIESIHLAEVPLGFNRNFQGMMITVPGALRLQRPHSDFFNAQDSLSTNVNGQSRLANNVQIEGIDDNHRTGLLTTLIPSAEAIETVNISTSAYDAEFGRAGGAITNVTLKSGTNTLKGSVFAFGNNEKTNAPGYFSHTSPPGDYLQSGFTLGGPLRRNQLFFFGDYQHIRDNAGRTTRAIIPPAAYRAGDFSASPTTIYDPLTGNADGTGRTAFPNNVIPANRISPIARAILANVPAPNVAAAPGQPNYQIDYARVKTTDSFDTKINWQMSQADQISARLSFLRPKLDDPAEFGPFGGSKQGSPSGNGFSGIGTDTTYSTGVNYTRTWSSTLVMEARGGMNYFHNEALSGGDGLKTAEEVGIRGANIDDWTSGMTSIDFGTNLSLSSPLVGFSGSLPWDRSERTVQFATVFTKVAGNHTIKFGEDFRHTRDFLLQTQDNGGPRGQFQFRAPQTSIPGDAAATGGFANAFASFLLDVPSLVQRDLKVTDPGVRFWAFFSFLQDKWAVSPKLTIDLGLRHEYYTPFIGLVDQGGLSNYDSATNTLQVAGYGNVSGSVGVQKYLKNFGPRAGVSYRLNDRTVLRGGYGVSTLPFPDNSYAYNYPVKQNNVFTAPNDFAPAPRSMSTGFPDPVFVQIPSNGILDAGAPVLRNAGYFHVQPDMHEGSLHSFNVAFQRELPARFTLDVAYVGNRGHDVQTRYNENAATVVGLPGNTGRPLFLPFGKSADVDTWIGTKTEYNSLQAKLDRRFSGGLLMTTSYTLGRGWSYVDGDSNTSILTPADFERSWARTNQDRLHSFVESFLYQLPFGPDRRWLRDGPLSLVLGGWQLSGIFSAQTGSPIAIAMSAATLNAPGNTQRPNVSGTPAVPGAVGPGALWFDTSVFSAPAPNTFGNARRNGVLDGPEYVNLDATIAKLFSIGKRVHGEFRADIFNITNTPHFENPNGTFLGATFGQITTTMPNSARSMRFGFRMMF